MKLLGDLGHVESCFGPFETVLGSVQDRSTVVAKMYNRLINRFAHIRWYSLVMRLK
jgi:hypothetical protein